MKPNGKAKVKSAKGVPLDPVLFAATVPSRKSTAKDIQDIKEHENDPIEPEESEAMSEMVEDL